MTLTPSDEATFNRALKVMKARAGERIEINTTLANLIGVISMVQLALRHPGASATETGQRTRAFVTDLIERIDPDHGDLWQLLTMGFDREHDIE